MGNHSESRAKDFGRSVVLLFEMRNEMKRLILASVVTMLLTSSALAQPSGPAFQERLNTVLQRQNEPADLPAFDLRFEGGTPEQLADTIRAESGKPLNVIIPNEHKDVELPPLNMKGVNVKQLFDALEQANMRMVPYVTGEAAGRRMISERSTTTTFRTTPPITANSIWYFQVTRPETLPEPKVIRYYQLKPYLTDYKIDDLTTAIQAGWTMLGETEVPKLNFHADTNLLIAVGSASQLSVIDSVLMELNKGLAPEMKKNMPSQMKTEPANEKLF